MKTDLEKHKNIQGWLKAIGALLVPVVTLLGIWLGTNVIINSKQTQVVIDPREGDIIVKDGEDYKLLQLITYEDITFPSAIKERSYKYDDNTKKRVPIFECIDEGEDWSKAKGFSYTLDEFKLNPNKVINLLNNINNIELRCDFYTSKDIRDKINMENNDFKIVLKDKNIKENFKISHNSIESEFAYVTKETNNGFEYAKIKLTITYEISGQIIVDEFESKFYDTEIF